MLSGLYPPMQEYGVSQFENMYRSLTEAAGREGKQFPNELSTASFSTTDLSEQEDAVPLQFAHSIIA